MQFTLLKLNAGRQEQFRFLTESQFQNKFLFPDKKEELWLDFNNTLMKKCFDNKKQKVKMY